jgi:2-methylcitrate dehydratase PrpD
MFNTTERMEKKDGIVRDITARLANFISTLSYDQIPSEVVRKIKISLLDSLGCAFAGSATEWGKIINHFVQSQGGVKEASLWTTHFLGPAANVALGNGTMIHSLDFDDYHNVKIHPGAVVIPAAIAVGERAGADGKSVLTALVAGYETMIRVSSATGPISSRSKGWHLTGTTGTFGAAAAAGKLLGLNEDQMASALGMGGTQSAGLWAFNADGAMSKRFHAGRSSQSGVMGALLAEKGYRGPTKILEAEDGGFCKATSDQVNFFLAIDKLGDKFLSGDINNKPYACCASIHSSIDGVKQLVQSHKIKAAEIAKVIVGTARGVKVQCGFAYQPISMLQAQMSLQYCIAALLLDGQVLLDQFTEDKISDPKILELARRVEIVLDPEIEKVYPDKFASKVEIILSDGEILKTRIDFPTGCPENPMSFDQVVGKFENSTGKLLSKDQINEFVARVDKIEKMDNIRNLTSLFS